MLKPLRFIFCLICTLLLAGCFSAVPNNQNTYLIKCLNYNTIHAYPTCLTLLVTKPAAIQAFDTVDMAYSNCPYQLTYFSRNEWADTPATMMLPLMVQSLQNTNHFHAVVTTSSNQYDLVLNSQLIELQQTFTTKPSQVHLVFNAQLINANTRRVIATRHFCIIKCAPCDTPYGGVIAANCAVAELLRQLAQFVVANS